ncbi:MAG: hypothetical protein ACI8ZM_001685 [Crocinitomix sp.]
MKIVRLILVLVLAGVFVFLAYDLYERQKNKYSFLSFELKESSNSIIVPNINRLLKKINNTNQIEGLSINSALQSGCDLLLSQQQYDYNTEFGSTCFISFNATDFSLAFSNPDLNFDQILAVLNDVLNVNATLVNNSLKINEQNYNVEKFGAYTVLSTASIKPEFSSKTYLPTNADFFILKDSVQVDRYILANNKQFKVWNEIADPVRGNPIEHAAFIHKIPASFETADLYGSKRFQEDKNTFFGPSSEEAFSWVDEGLIIFKKGNYEIMLAMQNDQRDLRLILEEQTLNAQGDTVQINFINVKNFEIMPFETNFKWTESIPALSSNLTMFTEFDNFNILANTMDAMQWYLSEIQTGNLMEGNAFMLGHYSISSPLRAHYLNLVNEGEVIQVETGTWTEKTKCTKTYTNASLLESAPQNLVQNIDFQINFTPQHIQPFLQSNTRKLLISNKTKVACYTAEGVLEWERALQSEILFEPEFIDLDHNGEFEIALFSKKAFLVLNGNGTDVTGLNRKFTNPIAGGLCVNYDQKYDYRFFVVSGTQITCLNEKGETVLGWQFSNADVPLSGEAAYTQIAGVDFLTFKAVNNELFVLNRRGEPKFGDAVQSELPNESNFVTGKNEGVLHKLGYANQYIYNRYLKDGYTDSVKLDKRANAMAATWVMLDEPTLLIEEPNRIVLFNEFGYLKQEILKPQEAQQFLGIESTPEIHYVFFNNSNNSLYLLNQEGKIVLSNLENSQTIYGIDYSTFYTFDGQNINTHKLN